MLFLVGKKNTDGLNPSKKGFKLRSTLFSSYKTKPQTFNHHKPLWQISKSWAKQRVNEVSVTCVFF
jgi:hypothetical protein